MFGRVFNLLTGYIFLPMFVLHGVSLSLWVLTGYERETLLIAAPASLFALYKAKTVANWLS